MNDLKQHKEILLSALKYYVLINGNMRKEVMKGHKL
jgi:hypothetical protein